MGSASETGYTARSVYARVLREARPYWPHLFGALLLSLLSTPLALLTPLPIKLAIDSVLGDEPLPGFLRALVPGFVTESAGTLLAFVVALVVVVALLTQAQSLLGTILRTYVGEKLVLKFRSKLFSHSQKLSLSYHDSVGTTDSTYRIQYDAVAMRWIATDGVIPFVSSAFKLVGMVYVTALINAQLAVVALVILPFLFVVTRVYGRKLRKGWKGQKKLESSIMKNVQETLGGVRVVKAFGQEEREEERFVRRGGENVRAQMRLATQEGGYGMAVGLIVAFGTAGVLYFGVSAVQAGTLTLGNLVLILGYLSQLYRPLQSVSEKLGDLQNSLASAERAFTLLDTEPDVEEKPDAKPLDRARGAVSFRDLSFAYDENEPPALDGLTFEVEPGTRLGIAGTTGAGKTTLVSLLTRFYDPTGGSISLDGVDLRDYKLADLRNQFAIVLQEPVLFSTSVAENIGYARPEAGEKEISAAAKAAHAHEFINALPDGYDTTVGERGMRLSGGERQRISLARAFLKDAPILILDEPTSSVDTKTEEIIMDAMETLMEGRTTFMIAHRLSTLEHCDVKLRIEDGRLVERALTARGASAGMEP